MDELNTTTSLKGTNHVKLPLRSQLPPPFNPRQSYTKQRVPRTNSKLNLGLQPNSNISSNASLGIQDVFMATMTQTYSLNSATSSTCPQYGTLKLADNPTPCTPGCTCDDEMDTNPYEDALRDATDDTLFIDMTNIMTQCPNHNNTKTSSSKPAPSNSNGNKKPHNRRNNHRNHNEDEEDDKIDPNDADEKKQSDYEQYIPYRNTNYSYSPPVKHKAQNFIKISHCLTQRVIPNYARERMADVYEFINKSTAMAHRNNTNAKCLVYKYGFHDKQSNESLYCIANRWNLKNHQYKMEERLFTETEIRDQRLCRCVCKSSIDPEGTLRQMEMVCRKLKQSMCEVIKQTKWNRVRVFNGTCSKQCKKHFNKQRLTFGITNAEFKMLIQRANNDANAKIQLIPIVMFSENDKVCEYRVEYVQIVNLRTNVDIGISYFYDTRKGTDRVHVTGIHLNKRCVMDQHQLIFPGHHCPWIRDRFQTLMDDLRIGNPDEDKNKYKDVKTRKDADVKKYEEVIQRKDVKIHDLSLQLSSALSTVNKQMRNANYNHQVAMQQSRNQMKPLVALVQQCNTLMNCQLNPINYPLPPSQPPCIQLPSQPPPPSPFITTNSSIANTPQTATSASTVAYTPMYSNGNTPMVTPNCNTMYRFPNTRWPANSAQIPSPNHGQQQNQVFVSQTPNNHPNANVNQNVLRRGRNKGYNGNGQMY
eukprot:535016_1